VLLTLEGAAPAEVTAAFEMLSAQLATQLVRTEAPHSVG